MSSQEAPRISLRMNIEIAGNVPQAEGLWPGEETSEGPFHVLVGNQDGEIFRPGTHPRTPAAKRRPRFVSCLQAARAGCSLPRTMSVAPSGVFAKHKTCSASTMFRITGECVARSTWAS